MSAFKYLDYQAYLKAYIQQKPKGGRGELRRIAEALGVSPTLMSQILAGSKDFSLEQAEGFTRYAGFNTLEQEYFLALVQYARAGTTSLKKLLRAKIDELKTKSSEVENRLSEKNELSDEEKAVYYSSSIYASVWLYTSTSKLGRTMEECMERFDLERTQTAKVLNFLTTVGLCLSDGLHYKMSESRSVHVPRSSPHFQQHLKNWRLSAFRVYESMREEELVYTGAMSLSKEDFKLLKEEMLKLIQTLAKVAVDSPAEEVACFNMDFFWIR